jgi:hypothetical protein
MALESRKCVRSIHNFAGLGSGNKLCDDPLPNVAGSRRGHTAIASGATKKPARPARSEASLTDAVIAMRAAAEARATLRSMTISKDKAAFCLGGAGQWHIASRRGRLSTGQRVILDD